MTFPLRGTNFAPIHITHTQETESEPTMNLGTRINIFNFNNQCCQSRPSTWVQIRNFGTGLFAGLGFGLLGRALGGLFGGGQAQTTNYFPNTGFQYGAGGNVFGFGNNYARPYNGFLINTCGVFGTPTAGGRSTTGTQPSTTTNNDGKTNTDNSSKPDSKTDNDGKDSTTNNNNNNNDKTKVSNDDITKAILATDKIGYVPDNKDPKIDVRGDGKDNLFAGSKDNASNAEEKVDSGDAKGLLKTFRMKDSSGNVYAFKNPERSSDGTVTYQLDIDNCIFYGDNNNAKNYELNKDFDTTAKLTVTLDDKGNVKVINDSGEPLATSFKNKQKIQNTDGKYQS